MSQTYNVTISLFYNKHAELKDIERFKETLSVLMQVDSYTALKNSGKTYFGILEEIDDWSKDVDVSQNETWLRLTLNKDVSLYCGFGEDRFKELFESAGKELLADYAGEPLELMVTGTLLDRDPDFDHCLRFNTDN